MKFTPIQCLALGFAFMIFLGAGLLMLPVSSAHGGSQVFIDAIFTSTSAVTTTGLVVVDTGSYYSLFGQLVILALIQIGGLGYMILFAIFIAGLGGRFSFMSRMQLRDSMNRPTSLDVVKFAKLIVLFTFIIEVAGGLALGGYWLKSFGALRALYLGLFHSVSAFCTAGFGLFPDSFISYSKSLAVNLIVDAVCILGAIGFFVLYDAYNYLRNVVKKEFPRSISVHSKFVFNISAILMGLGALILFLSEWAKASSAGIGAGKLAMDSFFQVINASSTAGFNSVDIGSLAPASLFALIILTFIGASPGGTGAGIRTTTFGIMVLFLAALVKGRENVTVFKRRITPIAIKSSFAIGTSAVIILSLGTLVLAASEKAPFLNIFFEVVSAFSNMGQSCGITPNLTTTGKIVICLVMFMGRLGPLAIGFLLAGKPSPKEIKYADAEILVG